MEPAHYRPDIDGLRAVAVIGVIIYHLDPQWLPGGFAGVDVFFVISGFLISSIILRQYSEGTFKFRRFYQRRIARLFPALLVMALATLAMSFWVHTTWDLASTSAAFSATVLSIANFHHLLQGDYFELAVDAQPLLHCWSLAVEEQFYLVFPIMLWGLLSCRGTARLTCWILGLAALSFYVNIVFSSTKPLLAFYMLPARAWELLAGVLLAVHAQHRRKDFGQILSWAPSILALGGLTCIGISFVTLDPGPGFPGWAALLPVGGATLFIAATLHAPAGRWLCWRPVVGLGRLSYSAYLWHWPVFAYVDYLLPMESTALRLGLKLGLATLFTAASYFLVEKPCRQWLNRPNHTSLALAGLAVVLIALGPLGYHIRRTHYIDATDSANEVLVFGPDSATETIALMGDSQATMYATLLRNLSEARDARLVVLSQAGRDPLPTERTTPSPLWKHCLATIQRERPDFLVLVCHWSKIESEPSRLGLALSELEPHVARKIILLTTPPALPLNATRAALRNGSRPPYVEDPGERRAREQLNRTVISAAAAHERTVVVEVDPFFVGADGGILLYDAAEHPMFYDRFHFSARGAARLQPSLEGLLTE